MDTLKKNMVFEDLLPLNVPRNANRKSSRRIDEKIVWFIVKRKMELKYCIVGDITMANKYSIEKWGLNGRLNFCVFETWCFSDFGYQG